MQQWTRFYGWAGLFALTVAMVGITPGVTGVVLEFEVASETPELISRGSGRSHRFRGTGRREILALNRGSGRLVG
jgi:hypothetical protein